MLLDFAPTLLPPIEALPTYAPNGVRLPHLERGLAEALLGIADVVSWAYGSASREAGSLLSLRLLGPPTTRLRHGGEVKPRVAAVTLTVTGATPGRTVVELDGYRYERDVPGGSSVELERDALLALIVAGESGRMLAVAYSTDQIILTPSDITSLWGLELVGEVSASTAYDGRALRLDRRQEVAFVELQAFARGRHLHEGAYSIITHALSRLVEEDAMLQLANWGVAVTGNLAFPRDISAIAGTRWETRAVATIALNLRAAYVSSVSRFYAFEVENQIAELSA